MRSALASLLGSDATERALLKLLARGASGTLAVRGLSIFISFATGLALARLLKPEALGKYNYALSWGNVLAVAAGLSAHPLMVRSVSAYRSAEKWGLLAGLRRRMDLIVLSVALPLLTLAGASATFLAPYNLSIDVPTFWLALTITLMTALSDLRRGSLEGSHQVTIAQLPDVFGRQGLLLAGVAALYYYQAPLISSSAMAIHCGSALACFMAVSLLARRVLPPDKKTQKPEYATREWIHSVGPLVLVGGLTAINAQADILMLGWLRDPKEVGVYSVVTRITGLIPYILIAANTAMSPIIARLHAENDKVRLQRVIARTTFAVVAVTLPLALAMVVGGHWLLALFGPEYVVGDRALSICALGQLANTSAGAVGIVLLMTGFERDAAWGMAFAATLNIALNAVLIPRWGIEGAAISTAASTIAWRMLLLGLVRKRLGIDPTALGMLRD